MKTQHFVYALDCGTYTAAGIPIRIFGRSTTETFGGRWRQYKTASVKPPVLAGVIVCESKEDAENVEYAILRRFSEQTPAGMPRCEVRIATGVVLEFIENEMERIEDFVGMSTKDFANASLRGKQKPRVLSPEQRERNNRKQRERRQTDPEHAERQREYHRNRYATDAEFRQRQITRASKKEMTPERKAANRESARRYYHRKKRRGTGPGQLSFLP